MMHSPRNNSNSRYLSSQFNWPPDRCSCHKKLVCVQVFHKPIQFNDWVSRPTHIFLRRLCLFTYAERSQSLRWANVLDEFSEIFNLLATFDFQASTINLQKVKSTRFQTVSKVIASKWSKDFHVVRVEHLFVCTSLRYSCASGNLFSFPHWTSLAEMEIEMLIEFPFSINQKVGVNCNKSPNLSDY